MWDEVYEIQAARVYVRKAHVRSLPYVNGGDIQTGR